MRNKIFKCSLLGGIGLTTTALISSLGLMAISSRSKTNNLISLQDNQSLISKQQSLVNKTASNQEIPELDVRSDGTLYGFENYEEVERTYGDGTITLNIPREYRGITITKIAEGAFSGKYSAFQLIVLPKAGRKIRSVTLPDTIREVGKRAFYYCEFMTSFSFNGALLKIIDFSVFEECSALTGINIPSGVTEIGNSAFAGCKSLSSINIPSNVTSIGGGAFEGCKKLKSINIPNSVNKINFNAFKDCELLSSINIPSNVTSIGDGAFAGCKSLSSINIPNSVNKIESNAFKDCELLSSINIPSNVTSIGSGAFEGCINLSKANISPHISEIEEKTFNGTNLKTLFIPSSAWQIKDNAIVVSDNANLTLTFIEETCPILDGNAIKTKGDTQNLSAWVVSEEIKNRLLRYPTSDHPRFLSTNVEVLKSSGDFYCRETDQAYLIGLTRQGRSDRAGITIPATFNHIGDFAFSGCSGNLKDLTIAGDHVNFDRHAFYAVPENVEYYVNNDETEEHLEQIGINPEHINVTEGYFDVDENGAIQQVYQRAIVNRTLTIPKKTKINNKAITITGINSTAFKKCKGEFDKIVFKSGNEISRIDPSVFGDLNGVTYYIKSKNEILFNLLKNNLGDAKKMIIIQDDQFDIDGNERIISVHPDAIDKESRNITIPENYDSVSISGIGDNAFVNCTSARTITFSQSNSIELNQWTFNGLSSNTNYYVSNKTLADTLVTQAKINPDHVVFKHDNFDVSKSNLIVKVHESAIQDTTLTIPKEYQGIEPDALSEYQGTLTRISFVPGSQVKKIDPDAFREGTSFDTYYYVSQDDQGVVDALKNKVADNNHIIIQGKNFSFNSSGIISEVNTTDTKIIVPSSFGTISVTKIASNAFSKCSNLRLIEFEQSVKLNQLESDVFKGLDQQTILYVYNDELANNIAQVTKLEIGVASDTFFFINKDRQWDGLTIQGRNQSELKIPSFVTKINLHAFDGHKQTLNKITIEGDTIDLDQNLQNDPKRSSVVKALQFYVHDEQIRDRLYQQGIPLKNIHINTGTVIAKRALPLKTIGIIVSSICVAILLLGLGIGLPMRKQHKISILQTKLNGRRIDKLSAANAMAFKKVVEVTGNVSQQVNKLSGKMNLLNAAVNKGAKTPTNPTSNLTIKPTTNLTKLVPPKPMVRPTRTVPLNSPTRSVTTKKVFPPKPPIKK